MPLPTPGPGRPKGVKNKRTLLLEDKLEALGCDPIAYLAEVMMDEARPVELRMKAAAELAPYVWPKRRAIEHTNGSNTAIRHPRRCTRRHARGMGSAEPSGAQRRAAMIRAEPALRAPAFTGGRTGSACHADAAVHSTWATHMGGHHGHGRAWSTCTAGDRHRLRRNLRSPYKWACGCSRLLPAHVRKSPAFEPTPDEPVPEVPGALVCLLAM